MALSLLTSKQVDLAGLDIGSSSAKLIKLKKSGDVYTATKAVYESFKSDSDDEQQQKEACVEAIKRCFHKTGMKAHYVVCGLSGPEVVVRGFNFTPIPGDEVEKAIFYEARQVCPLDMSQSVLDYQLVEFPEVAKSNRNKDVIARNGLMVVAARHTVKDYVSMLNAAGVKPLLVDVESLALLNCLNELNYLQANETVAVIDVGVKFTSVIIYGKNGLPFVRDLNHAGGQIIRQISRKLDITEKQVQESLAENSQESDQLRNQVLLALNDAIRPLAMSINETLRFYAFQEKGASIDKIYLCGGFSLINTFVEFMADSFSMETEILNPFERILCKAGVEANELLKTSGSAFAVAAGLAMRTL